ncbi:hypothetical protein KEH51_15415 [[Brevibacterium] frigoritolerans]|uniref:Uncharacterized protein n=1 Tax=Peribacillus frigoritolerans TaxID=450367 RepID=A0A941FHX9_9BACI|nr:hypothetical protein [Peribacillus frigoritolerans]
MAVKDKEQVTEEVIEGKLKKTRLNLRHPMKKVNNYMKGKRSPRWK